MSTQRTVATETRLEEAGSLLDDVIRATSVQPTVMRHPAAALPPEDVWKLAESVVASKMFPGVTDPDQAFVLMQICQADGLHPMDAVRRYSVIKGRPAMRADAMQAEFQARGGRVRWLRSDAERCEVEGTHPAGGTFRSVWTFERAERAGLTGKDNWKNYPENMLRARGISEVVRAVLPGVVVGIYAPEEVEDFEQYQPRTSRREEEPPTQSRREPPPRAESETPKREKKRSPRDIVEAAVTEHGKRGGWCDATGRLVKSKMDALKAYAVGRHPDNEFAQANSMAKILAEGWALFQDRMEAEQQMAEEAKRKAVKAQPAEDEPAPFDFGDDEADDHFGPAGK